MNMLETLKISKIVNLKRNIKNETKKLKELKSELPKQEVELENNIMAYFRKASTNVTTQVKYALKNNVSKQSNQIFERYGFALDRLTLTDESYLMKRGSKHFQKLCQKCNLTYAIPYASLTMPVRYAIFIKGHMQIRFLSNQNNLYSKILRQYHLNSNNIKYGINVINEEPFNRHAIYVDDKGLCMLIIPRKYYRD